MEVFHIIRSIGDILTIIVIIVTFITTISIKFNDFKHLRQKVEDGFKKTGEELKEVKAEIKCMKEIQMKHEGEINYIRGKINGI